MSQETRTNSVFPQGPSSSSHPRGLQRAGVRGTKTGVSLGHMVQAERSSTSQLKERAVRAGAERTSRKVGLGRKAWLDFVGGQTDQPDAGGPANFRDASGLSWRNLQLIPSGGRNMGAGEQARRLPASPSDQEGPQIRLKGTTPGCDICHLSCHPMASSSDKGRSAFNSSQEEHFSGAQLL